MLTTYSLVKRKAKLNEQGLLKWTTNASSLRHGFSWRSKREWLAVCHIDHFRQYFRTCSQPSAKHYCCCYVVTCCCCCCCYVVVTWVPVVLHLYWRYLSLKAVSVFSSSQVFRMRSQLVVRNKFLMSYRRSVVVTTSVNKHIFHNTITFLILFLLLEWLQSVTLSL
jgi:hypothetical protein